MSLPVWSYIPFRRGAWSQKGGLVLGWGVWSQGRRGYKNITFQQLRLRELIMTVAFYHLLHAIKLHSISVNLFLRWNEAHF